MKRAVIQSIGHSVPETILSNSDLEILVETTDAWIMQRTGIKERRKSLPHETASTFAIASAKIALEKSGISPEDIDQVIVATVTSDRLFPATSCIVQDALGMKNAGAFDVGAACAGFIYALSIGGCMIEAERAKNVLVIGVDVLTKVIDYTDRGTCVLFGDGAGAVVVSGESNTDRGIIDTVLYSDGSGSAHLGIDVGGSVCPITVYNKQSHPEMVPYLYMAGAEVYRFAVNAMGDACLKLLDKVGMTSDQIDLFVPHQANSRIIDAAAARLNLPEHKIFKNVHKYGNTSGGSIPIALSEAEAEGKLKKGDLVMTVGFGAGLVWGANLIKW